MAYVPSAYHERASVYSKPRVQSVFDPRRSAMSFRPGVVPGHEMNDTEFEEDGSDLEEFSGRRSEDSMGKQSTTTLSSVDELQTPDTGSQDFGGFNFQLDGLRGPVKSVEGPVGPHLFRMSTESARELEFYMSMSPPASPEETRVPLAKPPVRVSQMPQQQSQRSIPQPPRTSVPLRTWSPRQVAEWMHAMEFEYSIIETFFVNDISGMTLIDLQYDDLKELGIASFGQRHRLWAEIKTLKEQQLSGFDEPLAFEEPPAGPPAESYPDVPRPCSIPASPEEDVVSPTSGRRRGRHARAQDDDVISPAESASIVAIEQLLPKPHKCSKGEACTKWQKQQRKLARIATEFPLEMAQIANAQKQNSPTESGLTVPTSVVVPSVVASSDLLGDAAPAIRLEQAHLQTVQARDPQENVRQFLDFQHLHEAKPEPTTPPYEMFPPLSPPKAQPPHHHLASLPRLTIPLEPKAADALSPNRTAKPSRQQATSPLTGFRVSQQPVVNDLWRIGSPASEMDIPVTAIPLGPIERDASSSVPPDMRYGAQLAPPSRSSSRNGFREGPPPAFHMPSGAMSPLRRANSLAYRRQPSLTPGQPALREETAGEVVAALEESPTEIEADGDATPTPLGARRSSESEGHEGWMKKRRTRMLRHEWHESHFRLRGTQLAMHADARADAAALEYIDVDDYAVAVSAASGQSKLNAAFRRLHLTDRRAALDPHAFAFQLTPAAQGERRSGIRHAATGKTHHFAVRTAHERIDWMRELMLARARKQKDVDIASFE